MKTQTLRSEFSKLTLTQYTEYDNESSVCALEPITEIAWTLCASSDASC